MTFLKKIQTLPEFWRKIILWVLIISLSFFLFGWYFQKAKQTLTKNKPGERIKSEWQVPELNQKLQDLFKNILPPPKELEKAKSSLEDLLKQLPKEIEAEIKP